jgi:secreted PhoX family phosphatase
MACHPHSLFAGTDESADFGFGPILSDPDGILDLPAGFSYSVISKMGETMDDGLVVPGSCDGMAALPGPYGLTVIIRNHELTPDIPGPFGKDRTLANRVPAARLYDKGQGKTPGSGGTSTIVYDTKTQRKIREFMSLMGTIRNCAGGPSTWKTWITCEETVDRAGEHGSGESAYVTEMDHGYNFEVPVTARLELTAPIPLIEMGRFNHEAVAVDPKSGIVYQTEDREDGLFYRFLPNERGNLKTGGRLQALVLLDKQSADTRNWETKDHIPVAQQLPVSWLDMDHVESPNDDLRQRGFEAGAARFARGEGIWYGNGEFYFACTNGGSAKIGQIWKYRPGQDEGSQGETSKPGRLELFIEPNNGKLIENADNLTVSPWGDLIVCEDRDGQVVRLVGVTPNGKCYPFAMNHLRTELAGVTFSPDGTTLFVNLQHVGMTMAITGPWRKQTA